MSLETGSRLGPYELLGLIGAGGMGEVYKARDTRLGRDVAIKVLPAEFAADPDRLRRFEQEARAAGQLNHPNILTVLDVGTHEGAPYIVTELLEGETLRERLRSGGLGIRKAVEIAARIAHGLAAAHEKGIIHRDLKPANVFVTKDGHVKILDFGIAKLIHPEVKVDPYAKTTTSGPTTEAGAIVGTAGYISPEQLRGLPADHRSDIFALGCVLYEMLSGKAPFLKDTAADIAAAILHEEPAPIVVPGREVPSSLRAVVERCLEKSPEERFQSARDLAFDLGTLSGTSGEAAAAMEPMRRNRQRLVWAAATMAAVAALAVGSIALWRGGRGTASREILHAAILHEGNGVIDNNPTNVVISPDGRRIAYVVNDASAAELWVRDLDSRTSRRLSDLTSVQLPFWSPDGRWIAFFNQSQPARLWKIPAEGGAPLSLCTVTMGLGGTWSRDDVIVFAPTAGGPLYRVPAGGGAPEPVTSLDATRHQTGHRMPWFLPDGDHFLFAALPRAGPDVETFVGSLRSKDARRIMAAASGATYAEPGYLLFERDRKLVAQRFDASRLELTGEPVPVGEPSLAEAQWEATWIATASGDGRLASLSSLPRRTELEWVDRSGRRLSLVPLAAGRWQELMLAPDGRSVLAGRPVSALDEEVWLFDADGAKAERVGPREANNFAPLWAPDGHSFVYTSSAAGRFEVYREAMDGGGAPQLIPTVDAQFKFSLGFTPNGSTLLIAAYAPTSGWDLWTVPLRGGGEAISVVHSLDIRNPSAAVSQDGRWLAYVSGESGQAEVYVTPFPITGQRTRVSTSGGTNPLWTRGGAELMYTAMQGRDTTLMSVQIEPGAALRASAPRPILVRRGLASFAANGDGERLLLSVESGDTPPPYIALTLNWIEALKRR